MKITPVDVAHKSFGRSIYGLDPKEVGTYLQALADQLESLIKERNDLKEKIREKEIQIAEFKERDQVLKKTLITASQMSEKIREDSERKAELALREAQIKADEIQKSAHESLRKTYDEMSELKAMRLQFETNVRALAHAHLALVDEGRRYMGLSIIEEGEPDSPAAKSTSQISPISADIG